MCGYLLLDHIDLALTGVKHLLFALNPDYEFIEVSFLPHDEQVLKDDFIEL